MGLPQAHIDCLKRGAIAAAFAIVVDDQPRAEALHPHFASAVKVRSRQR
jgi:hypothetical protein